MQDGCSAFHKRGFCICADCWHQDGNQKCLPLIIESRATIIDVTTEVAKNELCFCSKVQRDAEVAAILRLLASRPTRSQRTLAVSQSTLVQTSLDSGFLSCI